MTLRASTGFRSRIIGAESFDDIFGGGAIHIYDGAQPDSADDAAPGNLLGTVRADGATSGLRFVNAGIYVVKTAPRWAFTAERTATAGWFRLVGAPDDDDGASVTTPRIDGAIGTDAAPQEMVWNTTSLQRGLQYTLDSFLYLLSPLPSA